MLIWMQAITWQVFASFELLVHELVVYVLKAFPTFDRRYWETREQRAPALKTKTIQKTDQEQQDPMEYLQSDEEDDEEKNSAHSAAHRRRLQEQRERMHGALALIELANLAVAPLRQ